MATYLIEYDLRKQRNYDELYTALTNLGARRYLLSGWTLQHDNTTCELLCKHFMQFIDSDDRLLVSEIVRWASYHAMSKLS